MLFMGKSTISMAIFHSFLYVSWVNCVYDIKIYYTYCVFGEGCSVPILVNGNGHPNQWLVFSCLASK